MRMIHKIAAVLSATVLATLSALAQGANIDYDKIQIITQKLAPNFYALTGSPDLDPGHPEAAGGRVGILIGPEGVFLVDGTYAPLSGKVLEAIKKVNPGPIRFLVDTHYHPDHTGGNPNFARMERSSLRAKSRLVKEFVRATSRKMASLALKPQRRLPLTGS
jgi:glyoxylase-like metal-dependent hydrolase (beta-lactamase superfamily II)